MGAGAELPRYWAASGSTLYAQTRAEVARKLTQVLRNRDQGIPGPDERITVASLLERWLEMSAGSSVRPSTLRRYRQLVQIHLAPGLGRIRLAQLTPVDVQTFLNERASTGLAPRTVHHLRAVLRTALNQAVRWGMLARNVAALAESPHMERSEPAVLTAEQAKHLLAIAREDRLQALYTVAVALGLRQGEALGLAWSDMDFEAGVIHVRHALQRIDGELRLVDPKTLRSRRTILAPKVAMDALAAHKARQAQEQLLAGPRWRSSGLVFTAMEGGPLDAAVVRRRFPRLLKKAGLPAMPFHNLRHSCASLLLAQGVPARVVMETLGHSQISLTLNTYTHVAAELMREAADAMDRALG